VNAYTKPEGLFFSVSQLKSWLRCSRAYEYRYIRGADPEFVPVPLAFGSAFHEALAHHYRWLKAGEPSPSLEASKQRFVDSFTAARNGPVPLQNHDDEGESFELLQAKGLAMVEAALVHPLASSKVVAVEQTFTVDLHHPDTGEVLDVKLLGVVDLVIDEGHRTIVEHKTAARKYTADQLMFDVQPSAYAYAAGQMGWGDVGLKFNVVTKTKVPAVQVEDLRRDDNDIDDFLRTAVGVLTAVEAGVSFPVRGWGCKGCQFKARCRSAGASG
jgi:hypothetical protein